MLSLCFHYAFIMLHMLHYALVRTSRLVLLPTMRRRNIHRPPIDDDMELNRKLAWAEWMGFPAPTTTSTKSMSIKFKEVGDE